MSAAGGESSPPSLAQSVAQHIEALVEAYARHLCKGEDPSPCVLGADALLSRSESGDFTGAKRQLFTLKTLVTSYELLRKQRTASVRELYYLHASLMEDSKEAVDAIANAQRALGGIPRHSLGLFASGRGLYAGLLHVAGTQGGGGGGAPGRPQSHPIQSDCVVGSAGISPAGARFILVVEKAAIFQRLVEDRIWERPGLECALVTGCGQPDLATRAFLRQLVDAHKGLGSGGVPVLGLVDYNPFGLGILLVYAFGSKAHPEASAYAVPELAWLGLRGCDLEEHHLPPSVMQPLCLADERRVGGLLGDPCVTGNADIQSEVERWAEEGVKTELEALMALGVGYMADTFLPRKLGNQAGTGPLDMRQIDALPFPQAPVTTAAASSSSSSGGGAASSSSASGGGGSASAGASGSAASAAVVLQQQGVPVEGEEDLFSWA